MKQMPIAGLFSLAALGAQAQVAPFVSVSRSFEPVVVTASRALTADTTLRDATVITRDDLDASGALSLAEVLQRRAGVEVRATGGPGQPQGLFIRGAGTAQTLVLIDGMRAGSATVGTTSIENIPIEMIERIEVVKGPMSSLYGSEAMGGVVQIFTRGKAVPHLFASSSYGSDNDRRAAAGITTVEGGTSVSLSLGAPQGRRAQRDYAARALLPRSRPRPVRERVCQPARIAAPVAGRGDRVGGVRFARANPF